jgi:hypothetical protein
MIYGWDKVGLNNHKTGAMQNSCHTKVELCQVSHASLSEKLKTLHAALARRFTFIDRVAVAIYNPKTDELKTFIHSSGETDPLSQYQAKISEARSLQEIRESGKPRFG